jgi:hypothetical protein
MDTQGATIYESGVFRRATDKGSMDSKNDVRECTIQKKKTSQCPPNLTEEDVPAAAVAKKQHHPLPASAFGEAIGPAFPPGC